MDSRNFDISLQLVLLLISVCTSNTVLPQSDGTTTPDILSSTAESLNSTTLDGVAVNTPETSRITDKSTTNGDVTKSMVSNSNTEILIEQDSGTKAVTKLSISTCHSKITTDDTFILNNTLNSTESRLNGTEKADKLRYKTIVGTIDLVLVIFGWFGNTLTIIIWRRLQQRQPSSTGLYFSALAVSDSILLLTNALEPHIRLVWNIEVLNFHPLLCKLNNFLGVSSTGTSAWILTAFTIERVISVVSPISHRIKCSLNITKIAIILIWVFIFLLNSHYLVGMSLANDKFCAPVGVVYNNLFKKVIPLAEITQTFVIPFITILIGNIILICQLIRIRTRRAKLSTSDAGNQMTMYVTVNLVLVNFAFLFLASPVAILFVTKPMDMNSLESQGLIVLVDSFVAVSNLNAVINFYLYILSGSKFRLELKSWLCPSCSRTIQT